MWRFLALLPSLASALTCTPTDGTCYSDQAGPRALNLSIYTRSSLSATECTNSCASQGLEYAGLTGHPDPGATYYCYCGASITPGAVTAPAAQCSLPCPANASESCGGNYRLEVYRAACDGPIPKPLAPGPACSQPEVQGLPFCDTALPLTERVADLVARIALEEIGPQLTARYSPAIPRLGINAFYWGGESGRGVASPDLPAACPERSPLTLSHYASPHP